MIALVMAISVAIGARILVPRWVGRASSGSKTPAQTAGDRRPLPLQRIAGRPGGDLVLEAMEASGGWENWEAHRAVSFRVQGVFFGENGEIRETKSERCTLKLDPPLRVMIESEDGSTRIGFGSGGAWGARRQSDGRWNPAFGPGGLPDQTLRELALDAAWVFSLPFNLGEADAEFNSPPDTAAADSLIRLMVSYPPAPGEHQGRVRVLGFDAESGHILEVRFTAAAANDTTEPAEAAAMAGPEWSGPAEGSEKPGEETSAKPAPGTAKFLLTLRGYTDFGGVWRPVRRALFDTGSAGQPIRCIYEQRLDDVVWDPPISGDMFERPPAL